ncbi:MAG TPA: signal peptide peptidase SppA [Verrucomicrobiae bacterium]|jgi:protease-4|nr:signal peptide peptidase SppA [Verrucomicrobiae bacterium]
MDSDLPPDTNVPPIAAPPPPPIHRPPPVIPLPPTPPPLPPRAPRSGAGLKIFAVLLVVILAVSLLVNLQYFVRSFAGNRVKLTGGDSYGPRMDETTVKESEISTTNKIVMIPVEGVISGEAAQQGGYSIVTLVKEELKRAKENDDVRAVILKVDSPGGEVLASDEIAKAIRKFENSCDKPVVVSMGSLAASGGYYISAPCDWIVANELTITGSIGVIMHGLNYRGLLDKIGVRPEVFKSGKYKDMLSPTKTPDEESPEEKEMIQNMINETFGKFKSVVADGRRTSFERDHGKMLSPDWQDYADGRILSGKEAYKLGFVDEVGDFDDAVERAKQLAHIKRADVVTYQEVFDLSNLLHIFGESNAKSVKVELGVDIPKLHAGYLYFISPTYLQ